MINLLDDELQPVAWKWLAYTLPNFKSCRTAWRNWVSLMAQACTRKSSRRSRPFEGMSTKPLRHVGQGLRTHSCALWLSVLPESGQVYRGDQGSPSAFSQVDLMFASSYGSNILGSIHRWLRWSQFNSRSYIHRIIGTFIELTTWIWDLIEHRANHKSIMNAPWPFEWDKDMDKA